MNTPTKLGVYSLGLAVAFAGALGVGRVAGSEPTPPATHPTATDHVGVDSDDSAGRVNLAPVPGGLQVSEAGYRLAPLTPSLSVGTTADFRFRILTADGNPVISFTPTHEKDLHLIVVRRDLSGFQHLHPSMAADGTWTVPLTVAAAGQYRVFADFQPADRASALALGVDLPAAGGYQPRPLPAPARSVEVDGYWVELAADLVPGTSSALTLRVSRDGTPVSDLQPYLGAYGHLVALRDGDLAYLHVHPDGAPGDGRTAAGPDITFSAEVPSAGTYRLYLDFRHNSTVRTAEFTAVAGDAAAGPPSPPTQPSPSGHDDQPHGHGQGAQR